MKLIFTFVLLYILIPAQAQISVGVRDNKYAHITYCLHDAWSFKTEHSAFSEKMGYQYLRATIGYGKHWKRSEWIYLLIWEPHGMAVFIIAVLK